MAQTHDDANVYYVPHHSPWPFIGSITLFTAMVGVANWFNGHAWGQPVFFIGFVATLAVLFGCNLCYATPIAYQTNMLIMAEGSYEFKDYIRTGVPLVLLMTVTLLILLVITYKM